VPAQHWLCRPFNEVDIMKRLRIAGVLSATLTLLLAAQAAHAQQPLDAATVRGDLGVLQQMYEGQFRTTPFPGIYLMVRPRPQSARTTAPILMTRDAEITFNNGALGPQEGESRRKLSLAEWGTLLMRWRQSFRFEDFIQFGGNGPLRMVVISGFDCPYSKKLEAELAKANARYAVAPGTIGSANQRYLPDIWCAADRSAAWRNAINGKGLPPRAQATCRYDAAYFETFNGMMGSSMPNVLYADGTVASGSDPAKVLAKLAELKQRDVHF